MACCQGQVGASPDTTGLFRTHYADDLIGVRLLSYIPSVQPKLHAYNFAFLCQQDTSSRLHCHQTIDIISVPCIQHPGTLSNLRLTLTTQNDCIHEEFLDSSHPTLQMTTVMRLFVDKVTLACQ